MPKQILRLIHYFVSYFFREGDDGISNIGDSCS